MTADSPGKTRLSIPALHSISFITRPVLVIESEHEKTTFKHSEYFASQQTLAETTTMRMMRTLAAMKKETTAWIVNRKALI